LDICIGRGHNLDRSDVSDFDAKAAITRSPFYSLTLLSLLAAGSYSSSAPFWALPSEFMTGFSAAAGIALVNSIGALGGFAGPYMIGAIAMRTGNLYGGLALAGFFLFVSAVLVLLLPRRAPTQMANHGQ
jgi:ACS family tartrate transporter-like MFS transporter